MDFIEKIKELLSKKKAEAPNYNEQTGWDAQKGEYVQQDSPWMRMQFGSTDTRKKVSAGFKRAK